MEFENDRSLKDEFFDFEKEASGYFVVAEKVIGAVPHLFSKFDPPIYCTEYWDKLLPDAQVYAKKVEENLLTIAGRIVIALAKAPLASEADRVDLVLAVKTMRAAINLRKFQAWPIEVLHDEGRVLGVQPPGQSEDRPSPPSSAQVSFSDSATRIRRILDLIAASQGLSSPGAEVVLGAARYRPGTAFIMMTIDKSRPDLDDVVDTVKKVFERFNIRAIRADEIEHEELISKRILDEIETSEFLFADLTGERPNVYYEVGYAHALKRRVILFRKEGTGIHFDLAGYNCPSYESLRDLTDKLTKRLQQVTNKDPNHDRGMGL